MELQIDAKELLKQVLNDVEPGENVDEAIFRACNRRYSRNSLRVCVRNSARHLRQTPVSTQ